MDYLKKYMSGFGMKFEGWRKAAQKAGHYFRRLEEGDEIFLRNGMKRRDAKLRSDEKRLRQRHPPLASLTDRGQWGGAWRVEAGKAGGGEGGRGNGGKGGGGERGAVMPKRLNSEFGRHRLESCRVSNGRHKIA